MRLTPPLLTLALGLASAATLPLTLHLPPGLAPSSRTHATLSAPGLRLSAPLTSSRTFVFRDVPPGSYLVDVHSPTEGFMPMRVDVDADRTAVRAWDTYRGNEWDNRGEALTRRDDDGGFDVRVLGPKVYFMDRPSFSILSILMNPMILMGLVSMLIFIGMPKLVENMDPETRAEWEASQKDNPMNALFGGGGGKQQANPLGNFDMAAYLAGSNKKDAAAASGASAAGGAAAAEVERRAKSQGVRR